MQTNPKQTKRTHLKHTDNKSRVDQQDQRWLRRFLVILTVLTAISLAFIWYYNHDQWAQENEDIYVTVQVKTVVGDSQNIVCKLSLLVDPEQEGGIQSRQTMLQSVVTSALAEIYQGDQRPTAAQVRQSLYFAINQKLPRKLKIRDVLIQELLIGS